MQHQKRFVFFSAVLLLLAARGCHSKLMCYVCDHCTKITPATQLITCDESFFHSGGTELPSTMTTTEMSTMSETTTTTMESSTTTTMMTTTEIMTESTTTPATTSTQSTEPPVPTPPTNVPVETTTALPTPPLIGTVPVMMDQMSNTTMAMPVQPMNVMTGDQAMMMRMNATTSEAPDYLNLSEFRVRQARHVTPAKADGISYHCYTLQLTNNNTMNTQRGCARVTTPESVCGQLEMLATNETSINKCKYCSTNRCNGSSALGVSVVTLLIALVASFLKSA